MADNVTPVTDDQFQGEVLDSSTPTLVDFWAVWCGPCKALAPMVEDLAAQYGDKMQFRKMNIDENPATPIKYGVKGIPTLMVFKGGNLLDQTVGVVPKGNIEGLIKKAL